ncbi:MAG: peptidoglycan DD-metalloendopeptidase family protein [Gammaproteobacteria bacterium]
MITRHMIAALAVALLVSCGGQPVKAPVGDRSKAIKPASGYHRVKPGESLYSIAWQYSLTVDDLSQWNQILHPFVIYAEQRLRLTQPPAGRQKTSVASSVSVPKQVIKKNKPAKAGKKDKLVAPEEASLPAKEKSERMIISATGKPAWEWPVKGEFKTASESSSVKKGIRLYGKLGEPVRAAAAGKVVYAGSALTGYGKLIIIKHNAEYLSAYAHNRKLLAKEGEAIKGGQKVALMGHSGVNRTQLYFEIRKNGSPVDPLKYLPKR